MRSQNQKLIKREYSFQKRNLTDLKGELWEDIPGLDGAYLISSYGRVKALRRWVERDTTGGFWLKEKILRLTKSTQSKGKRKLLSLTVTIKYERKPFSIRVARFVYFLFVKKFDLEDRKLLIGYKNDDPLDIFPGNLMLTTATTRITTAYKKHNRNIACFGKNPLSVTQYDLNGRKIASYPSISAVEKATGISSSHICNALKKKDHFASGFIWYQGNKINSSIKIHKRITQRIESEKCIIQLSANMI